MGGRIRVHQRVRASGYGYHQGGRPSRHGEGMPPSHLSKRKGGPSLSRCFGRGVRFSSRWRQENEIWLRMSRSVALTIVDYMQENHLSRAEMAKALEVSPQYLSRILSGTENFSIKSVAKIEATLGVSCLEPVYA